MRTWVGFLLLIWFSNIWAQDIYPFASNQDAKHFTALTQEVRCVVCQNQTIADSNAPLALDLRKKIHAMLLANKTDAEIKSYLVERYGEFILFQPAFNKLTLILWLFPFLAIGIIILYFSAKLTKR